MPVVTRKNQQVMNMKKIKHIIFWLVVIGLILLLFSTHVIAEDVFHRQRQELVNTIKDDVAMTSDLLGQGSLDKRVLDVIGKVPRHGFVPENERPYAYENRPLPIGYG
jgi:protein-L-isoaspartate(D-aspartate) O-methyltransferase